MVDRSRGRDPEDVPAHVSQALAEVGLVGVDEEAGVEPAHVLGGAAADEHRARLGPADAAGAFAAALYGHELVEEQRARQCCAHARQAPGALLRGAVGAEQARAGDGGVGVGVERLQQRFRRARLELGVLVKEQAVVAAGGLEKRGIVGRLAGSAVERQQPDAAPARHHRLHRAVLGGVVEHQHLVLQIARRDPLDGVEAGHQQLSLAGVHDAVGQPHG